MHNPYDVGLLTDTDAMHRARKPPSLGGDDFAYPAGSPILSPAAGFVDLVDNDPSGSGGRMVGVNHGAGVRSEQLHASWITVRVGDQVAEGGRLGRSGASAYGSETGTDGAHIHGHFTVNGTRVGWLNYLALVGAGSAPAGDPGHPFTESDDDMPEILVRQNPDRTLPANAAHYFLTGDYVAHIVHVDVLNLERAFGVKGGYTTNQINPDDLRRRCELRGLDWAKVNALQPGEGVGRDGVIRNAGRATW